MYPKHCQFLFAIEIQSPWEKLVENTWQKIQSGKEK